MRTIKGVYENGKIKLLEQPPVSSSVNNALITFPEDGDNEELIIRNFVLENTLQNAQEYLRESKEDLYQ